MAQNPIILIPARLAATRFPNKPLAEIHGVPMIVHVWRRAIEVDVGPVLVAAGDQAIAEAIGDAGGDAVMTDPELPSGSDRIQAALADYDPDRNFDAVINLQGDLPTIAPSDVRTSLAPLKDAGVDIATIGAVITRDAERDDPNVVKAVASIASGDTIGRCLYFTRASAPSGDGPLIHHIGLYAYRRAALDQFVSLEPGILEQREKLEQLRALEAGMRIDIALVDTVPLGVDTPADLERAKAMLAP
ncbi:MAG TPA: 3-deoxy-manno-octulosonate cytidylyltransferase [Rhodospirillaceae bacterium]|nr:3-deoxy-manno-octulosonate cytidylyltransferase [Rhodospirillaceae bacterium]HAT35405.1 3-deoxy-manno-octulosonate cytidylyltransferase [Rhodospirillaceae bacterium]